MISAFRHIQFVILFLGGAITLQGQVLYDHAKGGGTFSDCDSLLVVDFMVTPLGGLTHQFDALVQPGEMIVGDYTWTYFTDSIYQEYGEQVLVTYPASGEAPACLTISAYDMLFTEFCQATHCRFVNILEDPSCALYLPDFTISSVNNSTVGFEVLMAGEGGSYSWNFGDGITASTSSPSNTFDGPGPHEVCLTVTGPEPYNCTATICKWLYLGPGDIPCGEVLAPGFLYFQSENIVIVLDTSVVTGQNSSVHWDFGDGNTAEGPVAVNVYDPWGGAYQLCASVGLWGPLVTDTCVASACNFILINESLTQVGENALREIQFWPNPASDVLQFEGGHAGNVDVIIRDASGRTVATHAITAGNGPLQIPISDLPPGFYCAQFQQGDLLRTGRFIKQ